MEDQVLQIRAEETAVLLTINRPRAMNALNAQLIDALYRFFTTGYQEHVPFTAVIITGEGSKAFVAGADISEFTGMDAAAGAAFASKGQELMFLIERFHVPVIAAVNGFALGGGCELAMACHLRIASDRAKFGQPEANLGLIPGFGGTQRLIQLIGKGKALELMLTCDMIDADRAFTLGLVNAVVPGDQLLGHVVNLVKKIAERGPLAIERVIAAVNAYFDHGLDGYSAEVSLFSSLMDTHDFVEGTQAFLEKRKAHFTRS
jgi:enoyl-CoA hydratase